MPASQTSGRAVAFSTEFQDAFGSDVRERMAAMQQQIEEFVATLNQELATQARTPSLKRRRSLLPVIQTNALMTKEGEVPRAKGSLR